VYVGGTPVNAMSLKLPTGRKLESTQLQAFQAEMARIEALRDQELTEQMVAEAAPQAQPTQGYASVPVAAAAPAETRDASLNP
jgi:hypothetical protein